MTISHKTRALQAVHFHSDKFADKEMAELIDLLNYEGGKGGYSWFTEAIANVKIIIWCFPDDKLVKIAYMKLTDELSDGSHYARIYEFTYEWGK